MLTHANEMFVAFEGPRIPQMAQAVIDSKYLEGGCTLNKLKSIFKERGLGAANALIFLRYVETLD
jgi:hypothetical protein